MKKYHQLTVKEALQEFYQEFNLEQDGGINDASAKIELLKGFSIYIPNFEARKKVLLKHDIHHVLTGYHGTIKGEMEISAWEIATGCRHNWVALYLNYFGMIGGFPISPKNTINAYLRGKVSRNLYKSKYSEDQILKMNVGELRKELGLAGKPKISIGIKIKAFFLFLGNSLLGVPASIISISSIPILLIYSLYIYTSKKWEIA